MYRPEATKQSIPLKQPSGSAVFSRKPCAKHTRRFKDDGPNLIAHHHIKKSLNAVLPVISPCKHEDSTEASAPEARLEAAASQETELASMPVTTEPREKLVHRQPRELKRIRPPLIEQLQEIGLKADAITNSIRGSAKPTETSTILTAPTHSFAVGKLTSKYPSPVIFLSDRAEYTFHHPFEQCEVQMIMHYSDMHCITLRKSARRFEFRIDHSLVHFSTDYDHKDTRHVVAITFASVTDTERFQQQVLPVIRRLSMKRLYPW